MAEARGQLEKLRKPDPGNVAVLMTLAGLNERDGKDRGSVVKFRSFSLATRFRFQ
jgi:hypothetical protein